MTAIGIKTGCFYPVAIKEQIVDMYETIGIGSIQEIDGRNKYGRKKYWPHRLTARTLGSHPRNRVSITREVTRIKMSISQEVPFLLHEPTSKPADRWKQSQK